MIFWYPEIFRCFRVCEQEFLEMKTIKYIILGKKIFWNIHLIKNPVERWYYGIFFLTDCLENSKVGMSYKVMFDFRGSFSWIFQRKYDFLECSTNEGGMGGQLWALAWPVTPASGGLAQECESGECIRTCKNSRY